MTFTQVLLLMFSAILVENFIFSKFYGCCPFLGVSDKPATALGMGMAVTFVMTLSSAVTWLVYYLVLVPLGLEYLKTVSFILIIAALVQFIEMFLRKLVPALYSALGIFRTSSALWFRSATDLRRQSASLLPSWSLRESEREWNFPILPRRSADSL